MNDANILEVADLKVHFPITEGLLKRQVGSIAAVDGVSSVSYTHLTLPTIFAV